METITKAVAVVLVVLLQHLSLVQSQKFLWEESSALRDYRVKPMSLLSLSKMILLSNTTGQDLLACAKGCSLKPNCSSFSYNNDYKNCLTYSTVFATISSLTRADGYLYYEISTAQCPITQCFHHLRQGPLCLFLHNTKLNSTRSEELCRSVGGRLPILNTNEKILAAGNFVRFSQPRSMVNGSVFFLGAERLPSGEFSWKSGQKVETPKFRSWCEGQPDDHANKKDSSENCLYFSTLTKDGNMVYCFNDVICAGLVNIVVCEKTSTAP